jgi:Ser/Thr protein kinase RdoA (MazF antagonist)
VNPPTTTPNDVVHYLIERGLVTRSAVVDGRLMVVPTARRNNNFSVVCGTGPSYFVKSLLPGAAQAMETLRQEANLYGVARTEAGLVALREILPAFHLYDPQRSILVVEYLHGAKTLTDLHAQIGGAAEWAAEMVGRALASIHSAAAEAWPRLDPSAFRRLTPWALSLHQITPSFGQPGVQLQTLLLTYPEYGQALEAMAAGWRPNTIIHGDMKFDNCLILENDGTRVLKIVDWELADLGEDLWDVAGELQNYHFWSAMSTQSTSGGWTVATPFESLLPAIRSFWSAYADTRLMPEDERAPQLQRCATYAAARLLQSTIEMLVVSPVMSTHVALLLQTSLNILRDPSTTVRMIAGAEAVVNA